MEKLSLMQKFVQKIGPKKSRHLRQIQFSKFIYKISHTIHYSQPYLSGYMRSSA